MLDCSAHAPNICYLAFDIENAARFDGNVFEGRAEIVVGGPEPMVFHVVVGS